MKSVEQGEGLVAGAEGNAQTTRNGDLFVGWGALPYISEFSPSGQLLFNAELPAGVTSYRAYRQPYQDFYAERTVVLERGVIAGVAGVAAGTLVAADAVGQGRRAPGLHGSSAPCSSCVPVNGGHPPGHLGLASTASTSGGPAAVDRLAGIANRAGAREQRERFGRRRHRGIRGALGSAIRPRPRAPPAVGPSGAHPADQLVPGKHRHRVVAELPFVLGHVHLVVVGEAPQPLGTVPVADEVIERRQQGGPGCQSSSSRPSTSRCTHRRSVPLSTRTGQAGSRARSSPE